MPDEPTYDDWIERCRAVDSPVELTDRVMAAVQEAEDQRRQFLRLRLAQWIESSRLARYAACVAALLVGSSPFVYVAYVAQLLVF